MNGKHRKPLLACICIGFAILLFGLFNIGQAAAAEITPGQGFILYGDGTELSTGTYSSDPGNPGSFGAFSSISIGTLNPMWVVSEVSPIRKEVMVGSWASPSSNGKLELLRWDGTSWILDWTESNVGSSSLETRAYDIAYENSGEAVVAWAKNKGTTGGTQANDLEYRVWDGTSWGASTSFQITSTTASISWIEMWSHPASGSAQNDITLCYATGAPSTAVGCLVWNGTTNTWGNQKLMESNSAEITVPGDTKVFSGFYEQGSGDFIALAAIDTVGSSAYSTWNGSSWTATASFNWDFTSAWDAIFHDCSAMPYISGVANNQAVCGVTSNGGSAREAKIDWNGSGWGTSVNDSSAMVAIGPSNLSGASTWLVESADQRTGTFTYINSSWRPTNNTWDEVASDWGATITLQTTDTSGTTSVMWESNPYLKNYGLLIAAHGLSPAADLQVFVASISGGSTLQWNELKVDVTRDLISPDGFAADFSFLNYASPSQTHFRWYNDDGVPGSATAVAGEDTAPSGASELTIGTNYRLRMQVSNEGPASASNDKYRLEMSKCSDSTCTARATNWNWTTVPLTATTASHAFDIESSTHFTDGASTSSNLLTSSDPTYTNGYALDNRATTGFETLSGNNYTEFEWSLKPNSNADTDSTYMFRVTRLDGTNGDTPASSSYTVFASAGVQEDPSTPFVEYTPGQGIIVYGDGEGVSYGLYSSDPGNPGSFGAFASISVGTINPNWVVSEASSVRKEVMVGSWEGTNGKFELLRWDGADWILDWTELEVGSTSLDTRAYDIAYENSGEAVVAWAKTNGANNLEYRVWNGTSWGASTSFTITTTTGNISWIEMWSHPASGSAQDDITLCYATGRPTATVGCLAWNGTANTWGNQKLVESDAQHNGIPGDEKSFSGFYEQGSGDFIIVSGEQSSANIVFSTWNGSSWTATSSYNFLDAVETIDCAPMPYIPGVTNNQAVCGSHHGVDVNVTDWNGSAFGTATDTDNITAPNFDDGNLPIGATWFIEGSSHRVGAVSPHVSGGLGGTTYTDRWDEVNGGWAASDGPAIGGTNPSANLVWNINPYLKNYSLLIKKHTVTGDLQALTASISGGVTLEWGSLRENISRDQGIDNMAADFSFLNYASPSQTHFRWYNDDGVPGSATAVAGEDTAPSGASELTIGTNYRLRMQVSNEGPASASNGGFNDRYALQFTRKNDALGSCETPSSGWSWHTVPLTATLASHAFEMELSSHFSDGASTSSPLLTGPDPSFTNGYALENRATTGFQQLNGSNYSEFEFNLKPTSNANTSATYCFRLARFQGGSSPFASSGVMHYSVHATAGIQAAAAAIFSHPRGGLNSIEIGSGGGNPQGGGGRGGLWGESGGGPPQGGGQGQGGLGASP